MPPDQAQIDEAKKKAAAYWREATHTFVSSDLYYQRIDASLPVDIFPLIGNPKSVLDVAAGNGRYTFMLAKISSQVLATDISRKLLDDLESGAKELELENITTLQMNVLEDPWPLGAFDLCVCMGLTTILVDERELVSLIEKLAGSVSPCGFLLMRDTLSTNDHHEYAIAKKRPSAYWSKQFYMRKFSEAGFFPVTTVRLNVAPEKHRENWMTLFRQDKEAASEACATVQNTAIYRL